MSICTTCRHAAQNTWLRQIWLCGWYMQIQECTDSILIFTVDCMCHYVMMSKRCSAEAVCYSTCSGELCHSRMKSHWKHQANEPSPCKPPSVPATVGSYHTWVTVGGLLSISMGFIHRSKYLYNLCIWIIVPWHKYLMHTGSIFLHLLFEVFYF